MALNLLVLFGSALFTLALAEVAVRLVSPQQLVVIRGDIWMPVDTLGWKLRPDLDTRLNTGERTDRVLTVGRAGGRPHRRAPPATHHSCGRRARVVD